MTVGHDPLILHPSPSWSDDDAVEAIDEHPLVADGRDVVDEG